MKSSVLIIVEGDPRTTGRPAEAVRIAAGVGAWRKVEVSLYFRGDAVLALGESAEDLIDSEDLARHWAMLDEAGQAVFVEKNAAALKRISEVKMPFTEISDAELAKITLEKTSVFRF